MPIPFSLSDRLAPATSLQPGLQADSKVQAAQKPVGSQPLPDRLKAEQVTPTPVMDPMSEVPATGGSIPLLRPTTDPDDIVSMLPPTHTTVLSDPECPLHMQGNAQSTADTGFSASQGILVYVPMVRVPGDNTGVTGDERIPDTYVYCNPEDVPDSYYGAVDVQDGYGYNSTHSVSDSHGYGSSAGIPDSYRYNNAQSESDFYGYNNSGNTPDFPVYHNTQSIQDGADSYRHYGAASIQNPYGYYQSSGDSIHDFYGYNSATVLDSGYGTAQGITNSYYSPQDYVAGNQNAM